MVEKEVVVVVVVEVTAAELSEVAVVDVVLGGQLSV